MVCVYIFTFYTQSVKEPSMLGLCGWHLLRGDVRCLWSVLTRVSTELSGNTWCDPSAGASLASMLDLAPKQHWNTVWGKPSQLTYVT